MARKAALLSATMSAIFLITAACSATAPSGGAKSGPATSGTPGAIPGNEKQVVYLGFGGTQEDAFRKVIIPGFEKEHPGVKVQLVLGGSVQHLASLTAQKAHPQADVTGGNALTNLRGKQLGLLDRLNPSLIPNLAQQYPGAPFSDGIGTVVAYDAIGIAYNEDEFKKNGWAPPTSWRDLADPKFRGHVYGTDCAFSFTNFFHLMLAKTWGTSEKDTAAMHEAWASIAPNVGGLDATTAQLEAQLTSGEAAIAWYSNAGTSALRTRGVHVKFVYPKEGAALFTDTIDVVKGAPHPVAAQEFVNYLLSPVAQAAYANYSSSGPSRPDVYESLSPSVKALVPGPEQVKNNLVSLDINYMNENLDQLTRSCQDAFSGK